MTGHDDLEQRLPDHLKQRAPAPPYALLNELLQQTADVTQRPRGLAFSGLGWWIAGVAAAAALLVGAILLRTSLAPSITPGAQATPSPSAAPSLTTITLPVPVREKAIAEQAAAVFADRLQALGIGNFSDSIGDTLTFELVIPPSVNPADVDAVLHTFGKVEWLAWPDDLSVPNVGDPVPEGVLPLFDTADEIISVELRPMSRCPEGCEVYVTLGRVASEALATYTSAHISMQVPLAMDGRILTSPIIQGPIVGGDLVITFPTVGDTLSAAAFAAILQSGPLPAGWTVP